jgi:hypothetical protein
VWIVELRIRNGPSDLWPAEAELCDPTDSIRSVRRWP